MKNSEKDTEKFSSWVQGFYNEKAKNISKNGYEYARWFSTPKKIRQYKNTAKSLSYHLRDVHFKNCLEVGCGPGTWTKLLLKKYPDSGFLCLDISKEMVAQLKNNIKDKKRVKTIVKNFLDHDFMEKKFDFIFCSRAIEYIPDKTLVIKKFYNLMQPGGKGIIVSSPPHPRILALKKIFGLRANLQHTHRISVRSLIYLLKKEGFIKIEPYPILFSDFFIIPRNILFTLLYNRTWGLLSKMFASSYIIKFEKPNEKN